MSPTMYVPEAVFFDQDGVLVDSEGAWDAARRAIVAENGGQWKPEATRTMMGMSAPEWSRYLRDELGLALEPGEISARVVERLLAGYERSLPWLPGAVAAVRRVAEHWPVGLASSANREVIDAVLAAGGLGGAPAGGRSAPVRCGRGLDQRPARSGGGRDARGGVSEPGVPAGR